MPRYFFSIYDGQDIPDHEGTEFPNDDEARDDALKCACELLRSWKGDDFWTGEDWRMELTDQEGRIVGTLRFSGTMAPALQAHDRA